MGAAEALGGAIKDELRGSIRIAQDIAVPKTHDVPTVSPQICRAPFVGGRLTRVMAAVELDRQPRAPAGEIDDERHDDQLPGEGWTVV